MSESDQNALWEKGWDGHQQQQLERLAGLPLADKLQWLEEAHHLVQRLEREKSKGKSEK
jgi:hypothetical protein